MPDYQDLMELFLYFLMPSDAVKINKLMDYFLKVNLNKFYNKLNVFFQKQPAQVKIIAYFHENILAFVIMQFIVTDSKSCCLPKRVE